MEKGKIAVVLGGGSILGARAIGVLHGLSLRGIYPEIITGISVGALNGMLYANYRGLGYLPQLASQKCVEFWIDNITQPSDIIEQKKWYKIGYEILAGKFSGLLKTDRLEELISNNISPDYLQKSPTKTLVGATNMDLGIIEYVTNQHPLFMAVALASSRIPFMMPPSLINDHYYFDGGIFTNAAIGKAIDMGADKIYIVMSHPKKPSTGFHKVFSLKDLIMRIMGLTVHNTLENDLIEAKYINLLVSQRKSNKKLVELIELRPEGTINVDITSFNKTDIKNMIADGVDSVKDL